MFRIVSLAIVCALSLALLGVAQANTPSGYIPSPEIHAGEHHEQIPTDHKHAAVYQCSQVSCTPASVFIPIAWIDLRLSGRALGFPSEGPWRSAFAELDPPVPRPAG